MAGILLGSRCEAPHQKKAPSVFQLFLNNSKQDDDLLYQAFPKERLGERTKLVNEPWKGLTPHGPCIRVYMHMLHLKSQ